MFRSKMKYLSEEVSKERKTYTWLQKMKYQFPPRLIFTPVEQQMLSNHSPLPKKLRDGHFVVVVKFENNDVSYRKFIIQLPQKKKTSLNANILQFCVIYLQSTFTFNVPVTGTSDHLLRLILNKRATNFLKKNEVISDFVLKVCGKEEYIYGDNKLIEYAYIYESLTQNKTPTLIVISIHNVPRKLKSYIPIVIFHLQNT